MINSNSSFYTVCSIAMSEQVFEWLLANDPSKGYSEWFDDALQVSAKIFIIVRVNKKAGHQICLKKFFISHVSLS